MNELYGSVDYNKLVFKYVGPTISLYEYMDSKEHFNAIKSSRIKLVMHGIKK